MFNRSNHSKHAAGTLISLIHPDPAHKIHTHLEPPTLFRRFVFATAGHLLHLLHHHLGSPPFVRQIEWLDAWVFQISTAYLGCVLSVQATETKRAETEGGGAQWFTPR